MGIINLTKDEPCLEFQEEFLNNHVYANYLRLRILSTILLLLTIFFIFNDYDIFTRGLWSNTPAYEWLLYSHVALGLSLIIISAFYWHSNLQSMEDVRTVHKIYEIFFALVSLLTSAFITGWVDQRIHGHLTVYVIGCFSVAVVFNLKPKVSFWIYFSSYIIVMIGITLYQPNSVILNGHYLNILLLILVSWILSVTLYRSNFQNFLHRTHLHRLVKERTRELEEINQKLIKEVDERRKVEKKISRLASIVESTDDGIIGMTLEGIVIDWNRGAESIYGYSDSEIIGESIKELVPPDKQGELDDIFLNISQGRSLLHYETTRVRKDRRIINVFLTVSPIKNHADEIIGASTIVRDVTAQKKIEKDMIRMDQMNIVGEMAASIGHEVRNPMTTVRGFLQLLGGNNNPNKYNEYIPLMISELDRANLIITEFLSISRTKVTEVAPNNLNDIINSILPLVQADAINNEKNVTAELSQVPDLMLDDKEMRQMILNLARNGLEAMTRGGRLTIKTFIEDNEVILAVQDQGTGIEPEIIDRLGTPFLTTKEMGTGLGLAVCYGIAERHKAIVKIESGPRGSTFNIKFKVPMSK
ncbi:MAG TPA: PAS domain-containing sensor histidine kinase [Desulfosporosinus sp.]|nr:PAS domain-containing sensor histidine kinase [Desulfosporosinus sp.]